ncbi:T9SS type A sorting domain-containing protein [candidate division KSB1 bacterium]|nr:T9SS type A sorting domain-containing protein [candidate division KSB1 bacterium]
MPAVSARAFTLSGEVIGGDGFPLRWIYAVPTTLDTFFITVANPFNLEYSFAGLDAGGYLIMAYQDLNTNLLPDLDEPRGFYGDTGVPTVLQLTSDTAGIDITLSPPNTGGFSGTITYAGAETGGTFIQAFHTPTFDAVPAGIGFLLTDTGNGDYTAFVDSFGTYYARAFMDLNNNFTPDPGEPQDIFGGATPAPIEVEQTNFPDNVDFTLEVGNAADPPLPPLPGNLHVGDVYPNPFNQSATIPFELSARAHVNVTLFDLMGRAIGTLASGEFAAGPHRVTIEGHKWASGIYWVEVTSAGVSRGKRLVLLK